MPAYLRQDKLKSTAPKRYSDERIHDQGILFIQRQRDRKRELFGRALSSSVGTSKKEMKLRYEKYKSECKTGDDDDSCDSAFEEMMEIDHIIEKKWQTIRKTM